MLRISFFDMMLVTDKGRWALNDNSMVFGNVVYIMDEKEALKYHLVDEDMDPITLDKPIFEYIVDGFIVP